MTVANCILDLRAQGVIDAERAQTYLDLYEDLRASRAGGMGEAAAAASASADTVKALDFDLLRKKRLVTMQAMAQKQIQMEMDGAGGRGGTPADVALAKFSGRESALGVSSLEDRMESIRQTAWGQLRTLMEGFDRLPFVGIREPSGLVDVGRVAFGETVDNASAGEMGKAWMAAAEYLRQRFNTAGGMIGKRADWGLPTRWDMLKVRMFDYATFRADVVPRLDLERMIDDRTGLPFTESGLETAFRDMHEAVRTGGASRHTPGSFKGRGQLANQRTEGRFLVFKSFDDWQAMQAKYGTVTTPADIFNAMMGHVDGMAHDIAALEILGPNPEATIRWMQDMIEADVRRGPLAGKAFEAADALGMSVGAQIDNMWGVFTGSVNVPVNANVAAAFSGTRAVLTSAMLGSAALSASSDVAFAKSTRLFNGLPQTGMIRDLLRMMAPLAAPERKALARDTGLLARHAANQMASLWRYTEEANVPGFAQRLAGGILDISLLSRWTEMGRAVMGLEIQRHLAREASKSFAALDPPFRAMLERYGLGEQQWDVVRATALTRADGIDFITPNALEARTDLERGLGDELGTKLREMMSREMRHAVPEATLAARAVMRGDRQAGTVVNELINSAFQFKAFPISVLMMHGGRALAKRPEMPRWKVAAHLMAMTAGFGALSQQMYEIVNGRDPRPMDDPRFWMQALQRGGGAGIYGDLLFADQTRGGATTAQLVAGPLVGTADRAMKATVGNAQKAIQGKETSAGKDMVNLLKSITPGSNLWYTRAATDRLIWGELQEMVDPGRADDVRRTVRAARKNFGQDYFWQPDEALPDDAPDFSNVMGDGQ